MYIFRLVVFPLSCLFVCLFVCSTDFVFRRRLKFLLPKRIAENKLKGGSLQEIGGEFLPMVFCGVFFPFRIYSVQNSLT